MLSSFRKLAATERIRSVLWLLVLLTLIGSISLLVSLPRKQSGRIAEARVEQFAMIPGEHGETALITVRFLDGHTREILASRAIGSRCKQGDEIDLVMRGSALTIGIQGCHD
jgi:hypothetical protein